MEWYEILGKLISALFIYMIVMQALLISSVLLGFEHIFDLKGGVKVICPGCEPDLLDFFDPIADPWNLLIGGNTIAMTTYGVIFGYKILKELNFNTRRDLKDLPKRKDYRD